jgi:hypothetical protein
MTTKLNAEKLAYDRRVGLLWTRDMERAYAAAIREVAQPIADERDELREAVEIICEQGGALVAEQLAAFQAILAKYPK